MFFSQSQVRRYVIGFTSMSRIVARLHLFRLPGNHLFGITWKLQTWLRWHVVFIVWSIESTKLLTKNYHFQNIVEL